MKKLIVLTLMMASRLIAFSQIDTQGSSETKCIPVPIIKNIIQDLISGDSAKAQLVLTEQELGLNEKKIELKDTIIYTMKEKEKNYSKIIETQENRYNTLFDYTKTLQENINKLSFQVERLKKKNKLQSVVISSGFTLAIGYAAVWFLFLK